MEHSFWHERWQQHEIGFHLPTPNPMLVNHLGKLALQPGDHLFIPLCGKTRDIGWLLQQGFTVTGIELSGLAIEQLFDELGVTPEITSFAGLRCHMAENLRVFEGDILSLDRDTLGEVHAVYDRAALVALPAAMREAYTRHLADISGNVPQLVVSFEYDQSQMDGPPFSVTDTMIRDYYQATYSLTLLDQQPVEGGLKGLCPAIETVWLLEPSG